MNKSADHRVERPMRADAARNQRRILGAARRLLADRGLDITLDDVAAAAGVGVGTVYRRFANKQELIETVFEEYLREIAERAEAAAAAADPWQGLVQFMHHVGRRAAESRAFGQMTVEIHDGTTLLDYFWQNVEPPLARLLDRGRQAGELRSDVTVTDLFAVITMLDPVASFARPVDPDIWERYLTFVLDGMRAASPHRAALAPTALTEEQISFALRYRHRK